MSELKNQDMVRFRGDIHQLEDYIQKEILDKGWRVVSIVSTECVMCGASFTPNFLIIYE